MVFEGNSSLPAFSNTKYIWRSYERLPAFSFRLQVFGNPYLRSLSALHIFVCWLSSADFMIISIIDLSGKFSAYYTLACDLNGLAFTTNSFGTKVSFFMPNFRYSSPQLVLRKFERVFGVAGQQKSYVLIERSCNFPK